MRRRNLKHLHHWLDAEARSHDAGAERALQALFTGLPAARPRHGFAGRVLAAAGVARPAWSVAQRAAVAACLLSAGLVAAYLPPVLLGVARGIGPGRLLDAAIQASLALYEQLGVLVTLGQVCESLYRAFLLLAISPPAVAAWVLALAVSYFCVRVLSWLLAFPKGTGYVEAR